MGVTVHLSGYLKPFSNGQTEIHLNDSAPTVADVLNSIWKIHPALRDRVLTETGEIRQHVNIFVGSDDVKRLQGLETAMKGSEMHIFNAVSGG